MGFGNKYVAAAVAAAVVVVEQLREQLSIKTNEPALGMLRGWLGGGV